MTPTPPQKSTAAPAMDQQAFADALAAAMAKHQTQTSNRTLPNVPSFRPDPAKVSGASTWFAQLKSIFRLQTLKDGEKCALAIGALDGRTFEEVCRALLPDRIETLEDFVKLEATMVRLYDRAESVFAKRYAAFNMDWKGPENESPAAYAARVREQVGAMDVANFDRVAAETMCMLLGMKHPALESFRMQILNLLHKDPSTSMDACVTAMDNALQTHRDQRLVVNPNVNFVQKKKTSKKVSSFVKKGGDRPFSNVSCTGCGNNHNRKDCKFKDAVCRFCSTKGHIEAVCRKKAASKPQSSNGNAANQRPKSQSQVSVNSAYIQKVFQLDPFAAAKRHMVDIDINNVTITAQLDDGADVTIMSESDYQKIGSPSLSGPGISARTANGQSLKIRGSFDSLVTLKGKEAHVDIHVADIPFSLLGINFFNSFRINLVMDGNVLCNMVAADSLVPAKDIEDLKKEFQQLFEPGLGCCTKREVSLKLKEGVTPTFVPPRRPSLHAAGQIKAEFQRLLKEDVVEKVQTSAWAAPCSIVARKDGRPRLVCDFSTGLNDKLEEPCYALPLPEDIFNRIAGCTVFSQLDFSDAYHQIKLDEKSQEYTTISTPDGLFRYKRLSFGIKNAVSDYQEIMDQMLVDIDPTSPFLDDVLVFSKSVAAHHGDIRLVLARIMEWGFKLNPKKCKFFKSKIKFLGKLIDSSGIHPDPDKVAAIQRMSVPTDVKSLRSFLGLVNYYQTFIPRFREIREPLDNLLKNDAFWSWDVAEQSAVDEIKRKLSEECLLTHYDPHLPITVAADASQNGMGGVISHVYPNGLERPIQFFSKSLNSTQRKYSQTEKEGLALITAIKIFHRYLEGRKFTLFTDHKALLTIFSKKKAQPILAANRLHRWALFLAAYDFDIRYTKTINFGQADALSRLISKTKSLPEMYEEEEDFEAEDEDETQLSALLVNQIQSLPVSAAEIVKEYKQDGHAQEILNALQNPTPESRFSLVDDVILMNDRVYIPASLRPRVLEQLHATHSGITVTKQLARRHVYWPNITKDIEAMIRSCTACIQLSKTPVKATLASWKKSMNPGDRIHMDFAGPLLDHMLLIIVDSCSKWLDVKVLKTANTRTTLQAVSRYIADNGTPRVLVTDNGPQFASAEFAEYCNHRGIKHMRSPVYTPQSNGQAERMVDVVKRFVKKNILYLGPNMSLEDCINAFLLGNRSTPSAATPGNVPPALVHLGRDLRTTLDLLRPQIVQHSGSDLVMEEQFNHQYGARPRTFNVKEDVWFRKKKEMPWFEGTVAARRGSRMYDIFDLNGKTHRLHTNQLLKRFTFFEDDPSTPADVVRNAPSSPPSLSPAVSAPASPIHPQTPPLRRSTRIKTAPTRICVNPRNKSYY
uniref:RNA-directed DNA polymerase n=1 Tax=Panagrolaimus superbus TaxID=310955 RepID=A0A914Z7V6_9BILA